MGETVNLRPDIATRLVERGVGSWPEESNVRDKSITSRLRKEDRRG
jgi:hypothetical protein